MGVWMETEYWSFRGVQPEDADQGSGWWSAFFMTTLWITGATA